MALLTKRRLDASDAKLRLDASDADRSSFPHHRSVPVPKQGLKPSDAGSSSFPHHRSVPLPKLRLDAVDAEAPLNWGVILPPSPFSSCPRRRASHLVSSLSSALRTQRQARAGGHPEPQEQAFALTALDSRLRGSDEQVKASSTKSIVIPERAKRELGIPFGFFSFVRPAHAASGPRHLRGASTGIPFFRLPLTPRISSC